MTKYGTLVPYENRRSLEGTQSAGRISLKSDVAYSIEISSKDDTAGPR